MANFLESESVAFKPYAYKNAALSLDALNEDVSEIYKKGGVKALLEIPGIGKAMADHIEEYLKTGKIKHYENYKKKLPFKMDELIRIEGMGVRKARILYQKLGIKNAKDLEKDGKKYFTGHRIFEKR